MTSTSSEALDALGTQAPSGSNQGAPPLVNSRGFGKWFRDTGWRHLVGVIFTVICGFPILYVISSSLNPGGTLVGSNRLFSKVDFKNYTDLLFHLPQAPFGEWFGNTVLIGGLTALGTVLFGAMSAYAFSRMRFRGRRGGLITLVLMQMFPQLLAVVAIFLLLNGITGVFPGIGLNTQYGLVFVYLGGQLGVNTYLMYGFFNTVPRAMDEAARIDGAGHARIFFRLMLPLVTPVLAIVALLTFIATTGDYVIASVVLSTPGKETLSVGLYQFVSETNSANWTIFSAGAVMAAIPPMALFLYVQRFIVGGLTSGSVK